LYEVGIIEGCGYYDIAGEAHAVNATGKAKRVWVGNVSVIEAVLHTHTHWVV
jgi:hypothetical protein